MFLSNENLISSDFITDSAQSFTIDFYKNVASSHEENLVCSALSVFVVLAMAASGAKNNTALTMKQALHLSDPNKDERIIHQGFQNFIDSFKNPHDVMVKLASKVFIENKFSVKDEFNETTTTYFRSESGTFNAENSVESAQIVNKWCSDNTNDKIKELITAEDITSDAALLLLNAVYVKGDWFYKFNKNYTTMKSFNLNKTSTVQVPTMYKLEEFFHTDIEDLNASYVVLPYVNTHMYMVLVVPKEIDGLKNVENNLDKVYKALSKDYETFINYRGPRPRQEVHLSLPKFKIETTNELRPHLEKMGLNEMFTNKANFIGISDKPIKVEKVIQKAFIEVNEEGSEAAAATGISFKLMSAAPPPENFDVDRPFLYMVFYKKITLFTGRVTNPLV